MFSLKAKSDSDKSAGITLSNTGIALAIVKHSPPLATLEFSHYYPCTPSDQVEQLSQLVKQYKLDAISCNLVLLAEDYQLLQVDAPEVPKQDLTAALRWQIKDLIDFHIDDAVIDHIEMLNQNTSGKQQLLVVTSRQSVIQAHVDLLQSTNCNLTTIDIALQSARNILCQYPNLEPSVGILNLWTDASKISVMLNQDIYINRTSSIGLQSLQFVTDEDITSQSILDSLALELQRTFDYFESHSRQASLSKLFIITNGEPVHNLDQMIQERLGIDCVNVDIADIVTINSNEQVDNNCIIAIGGALRSAS